MAFGERGGAGDARAAAEVQDLGSRGHPLQQRFQVPHPRIAFDAPDPVEVFPGDGVIARFDDLPRIAHQYW